jgi:hypothetical protein
MHGHSFKPRSRTAAERRDSALVLVSVMTVYAPPTVTTVRPIAKAEFSQSRVDLSTPREMYCP